MSDRNRRAHTIVYLQTAHAKLVSYSEIAMEVGTVIGGRYVIDSLAASGGMGSVYKAIDQQDGGPVALKILKPSKGHLDRRLIREAKVLDELNHPAIVRYIESGETHSGAHFLAMEWLEGNDLKARLKQRGLSIDETLRIIQQIAEALGFAHRNGIVHRDVKPGNIFLPGDIAADAKLLDFGIARWSRAVTNLTGRNQQLGTPAYMSPEQVRGLSRMDGATDVFSLGCVFFECLTGRAAFSSADNVSVLFHILDDEPPHASEIDPNIPRAADLLVQRMLAKKPQERPSCAQVEDEVQWLIASLSSAALARTPALSTNTVGFVPEKDHCMVHIMLVAVSYRSFESVSPRRLQLQTGIVRSLSASETLSEWNSQLLATSPASPSVNISVPHAWGSRSLEFSAVLAQLEVLGGRYAALPDGSLLFLLESRGIDRRGTAVDQAGNAARCALMMQRALPHAYVTLATGRAVIESHRVAGEALDRAVALLSSWNETRVSRRGGGVRIDKLTSMLLGTRFEIEGENEYGVDLYGEHPVARTPLWHETSTTFVGRRRELMTLQATLDDCIEEQVAHVVLVTGLPGFGKSRLCREFMTQVAERDDNCQVWHARGDQMRGGSSLWLMAEAIRNMVGIVDSEPACVRRDLLRACLSRLTNAERFDDVRDVRDVRTPNARSLLRGVAWGSAERCNHKADAEMSDGEHESELDRLVAFVGELLKLPPTNDEPVQMRVARQNPKLMGDHIRRACIEILDAQTERAPLLVVIEDLHWGDRSSVELLDLALRTLRDRPLMVLALGRTDVHDMFPRLWREQNITEIGLGRLAKRPAEKLVRSFLGDEVEHDHVTRLIEQASGNLLHLVEMARHAASGHSTLPETVMAMVQVRIDALDLQARLILRAASVFGDVFWRGGVAALISGEVAIDAWLQELVSVDLIATRRDSRFPQQSEYRFRHSSIRDVVHETLTVNEKRLGHKLAGEWLETIGETDPRVLAEHFDRAREQTRAVPLYCRAAEEALDRSDMDAALSLVERAIECGASGPILGTLRRIQVEEQIWRGDNAEVARLGEQAVALLTKGTRAWYDMCGETGIAWGKLGEIDKTEALGMELCAQSRGTDASASNPASDDVGRRIAIAKIAHELYLAGRRARANELLATIEAEIGDSATCDPIVAANTHLGRALRAATTPDSDPSLVLQELEACAARFEQVGDVRNTCLHRNNVGYAKMELGLYGEAETELRSALEMAQTLALDNVANGVKRNLALVLAHRGSFTEARNLIRQAIEWFSAAEDTRLVALSKLYFAAVATESGDLATAEREARQALELLSDAAPLRPWALGILARTHLLAERPEPALTAAREAMRLLQTLDSVECDEALVRLVYAQAMSANHDHHGARKAIATARECLLERADKIGRPDWRQSFLQQIPDHVRTMQLSSHDGSQGMSLCELK